MSEDKKQDVIPGAGVDVGTANIVVCRQKSDGGFSIRHHRNMLYELEVNEDSAGFLERSGYLYLKSDGKYFVVGEDALKVANTVGKGEILRPMSQGVLNPSLKKAQGLLFHILRTVVGDPVMKEEPLRFSIPADPTDKPGANNTFHQMVLESFFSKMGYRPKAINEALANLYSEAPSMKVGDEEYSLSGVSISCGAGMSNICVALKGMSLCEFSITRSGDHIDQQVAQVTGETIGRVIRAKEGKLDLAADNSVDPVIQALDIYYGEFIKRIFSTISRKMVSDRIGMEGSATIVVCGGTAMPPHFIDRVKVVLGGMDLPFTVADVVLSKEPFFSVSRGCCLAAVADMKKTPKAKGG